jgi:AraC-like DNA-binding protein
LLPTTRLVSQQFHTPLQISSMTTPGLNMGYVVDGSVLIHDEGDRVRAAAGTVFFHGPHHRGRISTDSPITLLHCHLTNHEPSLILRGNRLVEWAHSAPYAAGHAHTVVLPDHLHLRRHALAEQLLKQTRNGQDAIGPGQALDVIANFLLFLRLVTQEVIGATIESPSRESGLGANRHVHAAAAYIESHLASPLTSKTIADHLGLNPDYLGRLFQRYTGESMGRYLMKRRIAVAQQMLSASDTAIKGVAARVGIPDPLYFSRLFRREVGCSPSVYQSAQRSL